MKTIGIAAVIAARGAEGGWQAPRGGPKEGCKVVLSSSFGFKSFEFK